MKNLKTKVVGVISKMLIVFFVIVSIVVSFSAWRLYENGKQVYEVRSEQVLNLMNSHSQFFAEVFDQILPLGLTCRDDRACVSQVRSQIDLLVEKSSTTNSDISKPDYFNQVSLSNDQPFYFVALKNGQLVKLFFSGEVKVSPIKTLGEVRVKELLLGERNELYGFQANVDGLRMTYLNDFYSEAEVIVPYKRNGEIIGAVVYLHGD